MGMDIIQQLKAVGAGVLFGSSCFALNNPLSVPLEGSMVRYNGAYYAMSAEGSGRMMTSENLVDWSEPVQVLPESVPGPYELAYRNGLFYLYAEGRGLAVSDAPLQPFSKLLRTGISGRQMRLFQDDSGALFSVNRRAGGEGEGEIWLQRYAVPWKTYGKPGLVLDGRRGVWDSIDSSDLGEPDIFAYRGNYYLLYAANHPGPRAGHREVGAAVNENPLRLSNTDKLNDPVLKRNADRLSYHYKTLLPSGEFAPWRARYTTRVPEGDWTAVEYAYSKWRTGEGGFGWPNEIDGAELHSCRTRWDEGDSLWVRREFDLRQGLPKTPVLNIRHEGSVQVFVNGKKVYESAEPAPAYSNIDLTEACEGILREEENVIAVQARVSKEAAYRFLDFGLLDAGELPVEPTVYGLSSPRLVEGPNGFEKWMTYDAWWNGRPGSGLDRVFFYGKELVVDGPTTAASPGYHPAPVPPTFSDSFPAGESVEWAERWDFSGGQWVSAEGALRQRAQQGTAKAFLKQPPRENYLFETGIRFPENGRGSVGVVAWSDGEKDLVVSISPSAKSWSYHIQPGPVVPKKYKLPPAFKVLETPPGAPEAASPLHTLRIVKNGGSFGIELDGINLLPGKPLQTKLIGPGVPGLYTSGSAAEFDGVIYTVGWDEYDEYITGWGAAYDGTPPGGDWELDRDLALAQRSHSQVGRVFKGDLLEQYEFTVNAQLEGLEEGDDRAYGIFPVFTDPENYLKAMIDTQARELVISGQLGGQLIKPVHRSLETKVVHRHLYDKSTAYRDITSWVYELRSESVISGFEVRWLEGAYDYLEQEFFVPPDEMTVKYARLQRGSKPQLWEDGRFYDADEPSPSLPKPGVFNPVKIRPEPGNYIGFGFTTDRRVVVSKSTGKYLRPYSSGETLGSDEKLSSYTSESDTMSRPQEMVIALDVESSYFFRCVKLRDRVIIELNGRPMAEIEGRWPASQVGLITDGQPAFYNGMMLYEIPAE